MFHWPIKVFNYQGSRPLGGRGEEGVGDWEGDKFRAALSSGIRFHQHIDDYFCDGQLFASFPSSLFIGLTAGYKLMSNCCYFWQKTGVTLSSKML